jgi:SAM-dependent methyltransferase
MTDLPPDRPPDVPPADFYTGVVAELYAPLRSAVPDPEPYARFVTSVGEPALELGCGTGDPMLDLVERGLDVEGVDSSADMLDRCRQAATARGLDVRVHHQTMQTLALGRRFRSIYLAGPTFNLLPDDDVASAALERMRDHLDEGGAALVPLFVPAPTPPEHLGRAREVTRDDGAVLRFTACEEERDENRRVQRSSLRYELVVDSGSTVEERPWIIHWHTQDGFRVLAERAGFRVRSVRTPDGSRAPADADSFVFVLGT